MPQRGDCTITASVGLPAACLLLPPPPTTPPPEAGTKAAREGSGQGPAGRESRHGAGKAETADKGDGPPPPPLEVGGAKAAGKGEGTMKGLGDVGTPAPLPTAPKGTAPSPVRAPPDCQLGGGNRRLPRCMPLTLPCRCCPCSTHFLAWSHYSIPLSPEFTLPRDPLRARAAVRA